MASLALGSCRPLLLHCAVVNIRAMATVSVARQVLSPNLTFAAVSPVTWKKEKSTWVVEMERPKGLALILEYMNAQPKHIDKFIEFYHGRDMHVLTVNLKPWQLFLPTRGSHVVAKELAEFLLANKKFSPIIYHGFSVGGYLWGEVLSRCIRKYPRYQGVTERIAGQILDSGVDVTEIPTAFPRAVLPHNPVLRATMESFIRFHMKTFYNDSTRYYIAARKAFTHGLITTPVLLLYSDSDPLSTHPINIACRDDFATKGNAVSMKQFEGTKHVMHFQKHKDEYLRQLTAFLDNLDLKGPFPPPPQQFIQSKL